nr:bifunctional lysylphosphatidylglycerol flippase/synthetase MprF [Sphingomonas sanxanigenens]
MLAARHRRRIEAVGVLLAALLGFAALHALLAEVHPHAIAAALRAVDPMRVAAALMLTAASYAMLTLYDVVALRAIGRPLPYRTAAFAAFTSYTLSHNLGFAWLTGGSARYRIYTAAGLDGGDVVRVITMASLAFWMGVVVLAGGALILHAAPLALGGFSIAPTLQHLIGGGISVAAVLLLALLPGRHRRPRRLPSRGSALALLGISAVDLAAASAALLVLAPGASASLFPAFFLAYALAIVIALLAHVPGGVGVFEAAMLALLPQLPPPALLAALIAYRLIYYLLPLALAGLLLALQERRQLQRPINAAAGIARFVMRGTAPALLAALVFAGGVVLLVSGSLPAEPARLNLLRHIVPLPFVETSHIAASLAGTGLLLLAPALFRRLDAAFLLARALLIAGAAFSVAKGIDYEEAAILLAVAALLQLSRGAFYRRTALTAALGTPRTGVPIAVAIGLSVWVGFFSYKHVAYQNDLWWEFAWHGDASRFLRASFAIAVALVCVAVLRLFAHPDTTVPSTAVDEQAAATALAHSPRSDAMLAYTGDKRFLRSPSGPAMLMYQVQGRSWIVMGDPIGARADWPDLLWMIRERSDAAQGRLLLYQISLDAVPLAIDLGLQLVKYGEEARVALAGFTLDGAEMKSLRYAERRAIREGASFEIVPRAAVAPLMPELRAVSDAWLDAKGHDEKAFSIGRFDPAYLTRFDCAVVRHEGRIVAFANVWGTEEREELSVDLMRHADAAPYGTMDFLFVQLMKWGREQGYGWFNLGLAPLSGIEARRLAPIWAQVGHLLYRHGEALYGFEGLRAYKEKFAPVWSPRYIAAPHGVGLARALIDLQTLVGGGAGSVARRARLALAA